jgi:hypothetical protein
MVWLYSKKGTVYIFRDLEALSFGMCASSNIVYLLYQLSRARKYRLQVVMAC